MIIQSKYTLDDEVYIIYKEDEEPFIRILKDKIKEIALSHNGILYYTEDFFDEVKEEEIVPVNRPDLLADRVKELSEVKHESE